VDQVLLAMSITAAQKIDLDFFVLMLHPETPQVLCLCCNITTPLAFMLCVNMFEDPNDCPVLD
jgi:hypothetical protein